MTDVVMPQMGESIVEGTLTKWLKKRGDSVGRDEPLFEISTDKVDTEIPSPAAGTLAEVLVEEGKTVGINTVVPRSLFISYSRFICRSFSAFGSLPYSFAASRICSAIAFSAEARVTRASFSLSA